MTTARDIALLGAIAAQNAVAGQPVTYRRPSSTEDVSAVLTAVYHPRPYVVESDYDAAETVDVDDFLIAAADLVLGGSAVQPAQGDRIAATIHGDAGVYEVMPLPGLKCWQWSGPGKLRYRIHTKRIGTEAE